MQARVDLHLNNETLFNLIDARSFPSTKQPSANVKYPSEKDSFCECSNGFFSGHAQYYISKAHRFFTNEQAVGCGAGGEGALLAAGINSGRSYR